jgi:hypothetical protein
VVLLTDPNGIGAVFLKFEPLFLPTEFSQVDLSLIPFDLRLWFDGTKVYLSAETEGPAGEIIKKESTYTPAGQILPPKSTPLGILESIIGIPYLSPANPEPNPNDQSSIINEWDDVWVAVEASNWRNVRAVEKIINKASKGK